MPVVTRCQQRSARTVRSAPMHVKAESSVYWYNAYARISLLPVTMDKVRRRAIHRQTSV